MYTAGFPLQSVSPASISEIFGVTHSSFSCAGTKSLRSIEVIGQAAGRRQIIPTPPPICCTLQHPPTKPPQRPDKTPPRITGTQNAALCLQCQVKTPRIDHPRPLRSRQSTQINNPLPYPLSPITTAPDPRQPPNTLPAPQPQTPQLCPKPQCSSRFQHPSNGILRAPQRVVEAC